MAVELNLLEFLYPGELACTVEEAILAYYDRYFESHHAAAVALASPLRNQQDDQARRILHTR